MKGMKLIIAGLFLAFAGTAVSLITGCAVGVPPGGVIDECAAVDSDGHPQEVPSGCNPSHDFGGDLSGMGENVTQFEENISNNENERGGVEHDPTKPPKEAARQLAATATQKPSPLSAPPTGSSAKGVGSFGGAGGGQPKMYVVQTEGSSVAAAGGSAMKSASGADGKAVEESMMMAGEEVGANTFGNAEGGGGGVAKSDGGFGSLFGGLAGGSAGSNSGVAGSPAVSFGIGALSNPFDLEAYLAKNSARSLFDVVNDAYDRKSPGILEEKSRSVSSKPSSNKGSIY